MRATVPRFEMGERHGRCLAERRDLQRTLVRAARAADIVLPLENRAEKQRSQVVVSRIAGKRLAPLDQLASAIDVTQQESHPSGSNMRGCEGRVELRGQRVPPVGLYQPHPVALLHSSALRDRPAIRIIDAGANLDRTAFQRPEVG